VGCGDWVNDRASFGSTINTDCRSSLANISMVGIISTTPEPQSPKVMNNRIPEDRSSLVPKHMVLALGIMKIYHIESVNTHYGRILSGRVGRLQRIESWNYELLMWMRVIHSTTNQFVVVDSFEVYGQVNIVHLRNNEYQPFDLLWRNALHKVEWLQRNYVLKAKINMDHWSKRLEQSLIQWFIWSYD